MVIIFVLCLGAILATVGVLWWRVRWHLRRSDVALKNALGQVQQDQEPMKKT
ncbi:MAG TPA: hypothetical protein VI488_14805 [Candidatus Angelobacter sp.]